MTDSSARRNAVMIQTMNYRVGFQRLYAVLTVAWIALVLLTAPAARLKFWNADPIDWAVVSPDQAFTPPPLDSDQGRALQLPPPPQGYLLDSPVRHSRDAKPGGLVADKPGAPSGSEFGGVPVGAEQQRVAAPLGITRSEPLSATRNPRWTKIRWLAGMLFLPPVIGYVLLFHVLRWVYRGFRPATPS